MINDTLKININSEINNDKTYNLDGKLIIPNNNDIELINKMHCEKAGVKMEYTQEEIENLNKYELKNNGGTL